MNIKRVFSMVLAVTLVILMIGCTPKSETSEFESSKDKDPKSDVAEKDSKSDKIEKGSESSKASDPASSIVEAIDFEAIEVPFPSEPLMEYPVEDGGKITMWIGFNSVAAKYYKSLAENDTVKQFVKDTGIEVEFVHPPSGQAEENFNLLVVSDSLPDILVDCNKHYSGGVDAAVADGVFADLTDLVGEYAPDYNYFLDENDLFRKLATTVDGKIYNIYNYKDVQAPYYYRPQYRGDWLKEWNMSEPRTFADCEAYFDKVLAEKPDVAPFLLASSGLEGHFLGAFEIGGQSNGGRFFVKEGEVRHTFNEPRLRDYLVLMNDWYSKGYISPDFTTVESKEEEVARGKAASAVANTDGLFTLAAELDIEVVTGPYPRINEGDPFHFDIFYFPQNGNPNAISAKSENKELALKFLNYGFTHQGSGVANFGETDVTWEMGSDGIPQFTDFALNNPDIPMSDAEYTLRLHSSWAKYRYGDDISMIRNVAYPETWDYRARWGVGDDPTCDNAYALPTLSFSTEDATEVGKLTNDINTYAEEMVLKFITGAEPLDKFDSFVSNVEKLGIVRLLELYQKGYDEFLAK